MTRRIGLFPNFFLEAMGVGRRRSAWFVMLVAAMATAALYTACFMALALAAQSRGDASSTLTAAQGIFFVLLLWASATIWYHLAYVAKYHWASVADEPGETRFEFWGSTLIVLALLALRAMWVIIKYAFAPLLPLLLVTSLRYVPGAGPALLDIACIATLLYPVAGVALYLLRHGRRGERALSSGGRE